MWDCDRHRGPVDLLRVLHADEHLDLHSSRIDVEPAKQGQRRMVDDALHGAHRGFCVTAAAPDPVAGRSIPVSVQAMNLGFPCIGAQRELKGG